MLDHLKCLCDSMMRHVGQTVTIFTTSGGLSGAAVIIGLSESIKSKPDIQKCRDLLF